VLPFSSDGEKTWFTDDGRPWAWRTDNGWLWSYETNLAMGWFSGATFFSVNGEALYFKNE
jgi:hypothetical protein